MTLEPGGTPRKRLHADEVEVDVALARTLLAAQFPQWADLPIWEVATTGTDNAIYRLGEQLGIRMPRIHWALAQIAKEWEWLPRLAPRLPAALPEPVAHGEPGCGYPYPWLVYRWLDGQDAMTSPVRDWCSLAEEVASFLRALQELDPKGAPPAGARGGSLRAQDAETRHAIAQLRGLDMARAVAVWEEALSAEPWAGPPVWVHADLLPGNVRVRGGALAGIIDWSAAGAGDPACEAMLGWSMPARARAVYRSALGFDDATWARGRGWALQQAALFIPYYAETIPAGVAAARSRLEAVLRAPY